MLNNSIKYFSFFAILLSSTQLGAKTLAENSDDDVEVLEYLADIGAISSDKRKCIRNCKRAKEDREDEFDDIRQDCCDDVDGNWFLGKCITTEHTDFDICVGGSVCEDGLSDEDPTKCSDGLTPDQHFKKTNNKAYADCVRGCANSGSGTPGSSEIDTTALDL